jgi:hypothetical protein
MTIYAHLFNEHMDAVCISQQEARRIGEAVRPVGRKWLKFNGGEITIEKIGRPDIITIEPKPADPIHNAIRKTRDNA